MAVLSDSVEGKVAVATTCTSSGASAFERIVRDCTQAGWSSEDLVKALGAFSASFGEGRIYSVDGEYSSYGGCGKIVSSVLSVGDVDKGYGDCGGGGQRVVGCSEDTIPRSESGGDGVVAGEALKEQVVSSKYGKNHARNVAKREKARREKQAGVRGHRRGKGFGERQWRVSDNDGCVSDESVAGTAYTVNTRTAVEIQAAQTLATRRVAENDRAVAEARVAKKLAEHRLAALEDTTRTDAVERLAAARMESRINREKLSSQVAYGKIDKSLKSSLGSAGSAGEFALKKQVKLGAEHKIRSEYLQEQVNKMLPLMPGHVRDAIAAMAPPNIPSDEEIFGDCPADWPIHIQEEYYEEQRRHDQELAIECADYRVVIDDGGMDYEKIRRELDACL